MQKILKLLFKMKNLLIHSNIVNSLVGTYTAYEHLGIHKVS